MKHDNYPECKGITIPDLSLMQKKEYVECRLNINAAKEFLEEIVDAVISDYEDDPQNATPMLYAERIINKRFEDKYIEEN